MIRHALRSIRVTDLLLLACTLGLLGGLYYMGWWSPVRGLFPPLAVLACLAAGHIAPKSALAMSLVLPFMGSLPLPSVVGSQRETVGILLSLGVAIAAAARKEAPGPTVVWKLLVPFGLTNFLVLFLLPHGSASTLSLFQATAHSVVTAVAVGLSGLDARGLARVVGPAGLVVSWVALSTPELLVDRTTSVAGQNANGVGMVASVCLVVVLMGLASDRGPWRILHLCVAVTCCVGVFVSGSRGAYLNLAVAALVLGSGRLLTRRSLAGWAGITFFIALAWWLGARVVQWAGTFTGRFRAAEAATESLESRRLAAMYSLEQGLLHPFGGVGLANLADYASLHDGDASVRSHVVYLGIWGEVGVVAAIFFGLLCWYAFVRSRAIGRRELAPVAAALVAGISVNWWPSSGTGSIALALITWGAVISAPQPISPGGEIEAFPPRKSALGISWVRDRGMSK